ncbi:hypothetical protein DUNSADRAFT_6994 [Dunaliella salina]|uniref:Uncharacterized protein n=1 Tax=Dunaliella salina TaxID=3046 RepID=A0ABQ7GM80_DUNSA|nr:hypothetical protein DUNSADRAFT_6994 [Dunaliella salina]|eukprot:KAF5835715.1 hypothetical protein DUNSADRAFT_6994 [Dunaliella salina]
MRHLLHPFPQGTGALKSSKCWPGLHKAQYFRLHAQQPKALHEQQSSSPPHAHQPSSEDALIDSLLEPPSIDYLKQRNKSKLQPPAIKPLPPLDNCKHFVNLTNGLEALPLLHELGLHYNYVRIQSTACEQQKWESLIVDLDTNMLMSLALGQCCLVWDYGSRHHKTGNPRALWLGLEFIRYALTKLWFGKEAAARCGALPRGYNAALQFDEYLRYFSKPTLRRMRYFSKWVHPHTTELRLHGVYSLTTHDDDSEFYHSVLYNHEGPNTPNTSIQRPPSSSLAAGPLNGPESLEIQEPIAGKPKDVHGTDALLASKGLSVHYRGLTFHEFVQQQRDLGLSNE